MSAKIPWTRNALVIAGLCAVYTAIALLATYPLSARYSTHILGNTDDTILHYWNGWWVQRALEQGRSPYYADALFHPNGVSLVTHNIAWLNAAVYALLLPIAGGVAAFNLGLFVNLMLCGLAAALLVRDLTGRWAPAALAGVVYEMWPYRTHRLMHPNLASTQFIPLFLMFLIRTVRGKRWRDAALTGLLYALVAYTRWQLLIPATIMGLVCLVCLWRDWLPKEQRHALVRLTVAGAIAIGLLTPPIYMLHQQQTGQSAAVLMREGEEESMQTDLLSYVTPSERHWALADITTPLYERYYADHLTSRRRYPAYLGVTAFALAMLALAKRFKDSAMWLIAGSILLMLALGPVLRIDGTLYPELFMPYRLFARALVIRLMRAPTRYNMFLALPVAVLAGWGADVLLSCKRLASPRSSALLTTALAGLVLAEYLSIPVPIQPVELRSPYLAEMAMDTGYDAVLNLPFDDLTAKMYMWDQITHGKRIVQGNVSRMPGNARAYIESIPLLASLSEYSEVVPELTDVSAQLDMLAQDGIGRILIHKNLVGADRVAHWRRYLVIEPIYEDDVLLVYDTDVDIQEQVVRSRSIVPGLWIAKSVVGAEQTRPGDLVQVDIAWASTQDLGNVYAISLRLTDMEGTIWADARYPLCSDYAMSPMPPDTLAWAYYLLRLPQHLAPGEYTLAVSAVDPLTGRYAAEGQLIHDIWVTPALTSSPAAIVGQKLVLREADLHQDGRRVVCHLDWHATQRMDKSYTVFVHVFDLETGIPVAQDDSMPRRGAFPTRFWWPSEEVDDQFDISLDGVPPGSYGLCLGVYDPETGERLDIEDGYGRQLPDGRLILPERVTLLGSG